jgi:hypothetical protein
MEQNKPSQAVGHKWAPYEREITSEGSILYALGIGFSSDPLNEEHFRYTYEFADEFGPFPTMAVVLGHYAKEGLFEKLEIPGIPKFNPMKLLHGEEALFFEKPLEMGKKYILTD